VRQWDFDEINRRGRRSPLTDEEKDEAEVKARARWAKRVTSRAMRAGIGASFRCPPPPGNEIQLRVRLVEFDDQTLTLQDKGTGAVMHVPRIPAG
jgi:hypothetical protein